MKRIVICLVFVILFVGFANAQTKSMTGKVISVEKGMYKWGAIVVKVGNKEYFVYMYSGTDRPDPKIVGTVDEVGRTVQFFYKKIESDDEVFPTKIVEVRKTKSRKK